MTPLPWILGLSDEVLLRILTYLSPTQLLDASFVCRRFYHLCSDSQLWRATYFLDFVLPRALRLRPVARRPHSRRSRHDDGGGNYTMRNMASLVEGAWPRRKWGGSGDGGNVPPPAATAVDWKGRYRLRHNWAQGKCALEELDMACVPEQGGGSARSRRSLVKIADGVAVTAEASAGLRAWNLRTRQLIAMTMLDVEDDGNGNGSGNELSEMPQQQQQQTGPEDDATKCAAGRLRPRSLALDGRGVANGCLGVAVGFENGGFGVWKLQIQQGVFYKRYLIEESESSKPSPEDHLGGDQGSHGEIVALAYSDPYLITAAAAAAASASASASTISLYSFEKLPIFKPQSSSQADDAQSAAPNGNHNPDVQPLDSPHLITRLKSHTSRSTIALSIRQAAASTIASVAYTFTTLGGWSIGIQDLHIRPGSTAAFPATVASSRLVYTSPQPSPRDPRPPSSSTATATTTTTTSSAKEPLRPSEVGGPTTLCYNHPYLLAALPDNTLVLHLCKSTDSELSVSRGIRLWGHTSGISDADVTDRGRAVSVSSRGDEIRVWELEGGSATSTSTSTTSTSAPTSTSTSTSRDSLKQDHQRSVAVKPRSNLSTIIGTTDDGTSPSPEAKGTNTVAPVPRDALDWEDSRRNWVGFDDEMVLVLKEDKDGRESLMVYDFT